ncbi:tetratricopeptide repeat protein [Hymenobacter sp. HMF4947]|uniref:histidine kinase n=1 Tax=Hymenobacter ginkgonis TaxID=2682976 RepID=A0A7K1TLI1_9BACT|nr:ATP-binding protein [Hymenobacter ginkgonis]MVN79278.1 tetratricopeptide repeat protein [Hymenobacter ginkgonis]
MKQHYSAPPLVCRLCLLLLGLLAAQSLPAQTPAPDAGRRLSLADTTRVRQLQAQANKRSPESPQALALAQQALALARQLHDARGEAAAQLKLAYFYRLRTQYGLGRQAAQQAQQLFARLGNKGQEAKSYMQLSTIEDLQGNPVPALTLGLRGLRLAEQAGDPQILCRLQATLGTLYTNLEDYPAALALSRAALQSAQQVHDSVMIGATLGNIGNNYAGQKQWPQALRYYQQAQAIHRQLHDEVNKDVQGVNIADVYRQQGRYALARATARRVYASIVARHSTRELPIIQVTLADVYDKLGQPDSALALARPSFALAQQLGDKLTLRDASDLLARLYARRGEYAAAYRYKGLYAAYKDTLTGEATQRKTATLRYGYELEKKQSQIALLTKSRQLQEQQSARQRQQVYLLLAGLLGVAVAAGLFWRNAVLRQRANLHLGAKNAEIARQRDALDQALLTLQATQGQLIQKEKMASLGELTAGIAHEIQNPLNFVNNFADVSQELVQELAEAGARPTRDQGLEADLLGDLNQNLQKISQHGQRASRIVRGMLEHSRQGSAERRPTPLNALVQEYLALAYQALRTKDPSFTAELVTDLAPDLPKVEAAPTELGRVLLNLCHNAFYAVQQRQLAGEASYVPTVSVRTRQAGQHVEVQVQDNGTGMSAEVQAKVFQPFFTTKPAGEGTGLGLSLSYDLITQGHGGTLTVTSESGQGSTFTIRLPLGEASPRALA